jgi:hypothetical protein
VALSDDEAALAAHLNEEARRREAFVRDNKARLAGDPEAKRELDSRWAPLQAWLDERETR